MEAGVLQIVALAGGGDSAHITDVLHHGGQGQRHNGHRCGQQLAGVQVRPGQETKDRVVKVERQTDPGRVAEGLNTSRIHDLHAGDLADGGHTVGTHHTQQNGNNLYHALSPDVAHHHNGNGHQGNGPVTAAGGDGSRGKSQTDADDDGAGNNGREIAHDLSGAKNLK